MFKRVQKRQKRKEKEEELGLDDELKEVLGLQDTDSDESESSSSDEENSEDEEVEDEAGDENDDEGLQSMLQNSEDEDDDEEEGQPPMSVTEAVKDPVYLVSLEPETRACVLCPGRVLKNSKMIEVHRSAKAHNRRFTRFVELVGKAGPDGDVRDLVRILRKEASAPARLEPSKRSMRRKEKLEAVKTKRKQRKEAARKLREKREQKKASAAAEGPSTKTRPSSSEPPKKKRKVADGGDTTNSSPTVNADQPSEKSLKRETRSVPKSADLVQEMKGKAKGRERKRIETKGDAKATESARTSKSKPRAQVVA